MASTPREGRRLGRGVRFEIIRGPERFAELAGEWDRLAAQAGDLGIFQRHDWVTAAWRRQRAIRGLRQRQLHVVTIRDGDELVLAAPFVRRWEWIGGASLSWLDSMTPLYNDILVVRDERTQALCETLWSQLRGSPLLREFHLAFVRNDAALAPLLSSVQESSVRTTSSSSLDLTPFRAPGAFLAARTQNSRTKYRRTLRDLGALGPVEFETVREGEALTSILSWLFARKRAWVLERFGAPNWLSRPQTEEFFQEVARREAARGGAWVSTLRVAGEPIAANLNFRSGGTLFSSKGTFDPRFTDHSPGWMLLVHDIDAAAQSGLDRVDFMIGEHEWKETYRSESIDVVSYRIRNGLLGRWRDRSAALAADRAASFLQ